RERSGFTPRAAAGCVGPGASWELPLPGRPWVPRFLSPGSFVGVPVPRDRIWRGGSGLAGPVRPESTVTGRRVECHQLITRTLSRFGCDLDERVREPAGSTP